MTTIEIISPFNVLDVTFQRKYPGYVYRREIINGTLCHQEDNSYETTNCYSIYNGEWIGNPKLARFLCNKKGLRLIQKSKKDNCVCSIGFNTEENKWYGWSHRAICGFGIGDKVFQERFGDDNTPFTKHGNKTIENMEQAKLAAKRFAESVS